MPSRASCGPGLVDGQVSRGRGPRRDRGRRRASVDLPEPLGPVTAHTTPRGMSDVDVAEVVLARPADTEPALRRAARAGRVLRRAQALPVGRSVRFASSPGVPSNRMLPPCGPAPGPISMTRSQARTIVGSCSTTITVFPARASSRMTCAERGHVRRVEADGRLVEHEEGPRQRRPERRREPRALRLAARERARLPVEREVPEAHLVEVAEARRELLLHALALRIARLDASTSRARLADGQRVPAAEVRAPPRGRRAPSR
jgi:hypothetical protein